MKLEGSLDAFSLPDIFQLLSFTKKTGGLHLVKDAGGAGGNGSGSTDGVVFFAAGQVTGASADGSKQPLARRLIGTGAIDDDALRAAVELATSESGVGVVRALLDAGAVDAELLRQAAADQTRDAIFDLLRWKDGDFAFVVDESNPDDVGVALPTDTVLADAEARRAAWETVSSVVPSPDTVLAMPVVLTADPAVSREEWALLSLVDGRRTVTELVDLTGSGQYAVVSTLAAMVQRGLLEVRGAEPAEDGGDHVAVVLRRQRLLAPLESFTPVVEAAASPAAPVKPTAAVQPAEADDADADVVVDAVADTDGPVGEEPELVGAGAPAGAEMLGGAHVPGDVVPPRPEPFLPRRQVDFDDGAAHGVRPPLPMAGQGGAGGPLGDVLGATATAPAPDAQTVIERDPSINRSLMLRLIAGVRGL